MLTNRHLSDYRKLSLFALVLCLTGLALPARAQFGFALSPMRVELNLAPGVQHNGSVALANSDNQPGRFRTEILDLSIDREAVPQFEKDIPSEADFSCKD